MQGPIEQRFMAAVSQISFLERDLGQVAADLETWLDELAHEMQAGQLHAPGLIPTHRLAGEIAAINTDLQHSVNDWAGQWAQLKPAQDLAQAFDDKVMLLVFGKFNAGKSSFCNFLADRFAQQGRAVRYFQLDAGRLVESHTPFKVGSTETTAQLQGVVLGESLLLLDTPGLHSVTEENAALTQRYTDSADGVLWLSSSSSPGQVQELDELGRELRRNKPLLPVITRSDYIEEDEIDGEICKVLLNKTSENRSLQEEDVYARASDKLRQMNVDPGSLCQPVSISCHAARSDGLSATAMEAAGFERLYDALQAIVGPALSYKQRQPAEMRLHHFEENVLGSLNGVTLPRLAGLSAALEQEIASLDARQAELAQALWQDTASCLPALLQQLPPGDLPAVSAAVSQALRQAFDAQAQPELQAYVLDMAPDAFHIEVEQAALATGQPDDDISAMYETLEAALQTCIAELASVVFDQCRVQVKALALEVNDLRTRLQARAARLNVLTQVLRA